MFELWSWRPVASVFFSLARANMAQSYINRKKVSYKTQAIRLVCQHVIITRDSEVIMFSPCVFVCLFVFVCVSMFVTMFVRTI